MRLLLLTQIHINFIQIYTFNALTSWTNGLNGLKGPSSHGLIKKYPRLPKIKSSTGERKSVQETIVSQQIHTYYLHMNDTWICRMHILIWGEVCQSAHWFTWFTWLTSILHLLSWRPRTDPSPLEPSRKTVLPGGERWSSDVVVRIPKLGLLPWWPSGCFFIHLNSWPVAMRAHKNMCNMSVYVHFSPKYRHTQIAVVLMQI